MNRTKLQRLICILTILIIADRCSAQNPGIRKYTQLDGYTASRGYAINQDEKGYIWLGTDNGGLRFDGNRFEIAKPTNAGTDAEILHCIPVGSGRILLLPLANPISYRQHGQWYANSTDPQLSKIRMQRNRCILDGATGTWWLGNDAATDKLASFKNNQVSRYTHEPKVFNFMQVINRHFIGYTVYPTPHKEQLAEFDLDTKKYTLLTDSSGKKIVGEIVIGAGSSTRYIVTYRPVQQWLQIYAYTPGSVQLKLLRRIQMHYSRQELPPDAFIDRNNGLWVKQHEKKGIRYYGNISKMQGNASPFITFLESAIINSVFVDQSNNVWFSSPDNALYFLSYPHFKNAIWVDRFRDREIPQSISGNNGIICMSHYLSGALQFVRGSVVRKTQSTQLLIEGTRKIMPLDSYRFIFFDRGICIADARTPRIREFPLSGKVYKDLCLYQDKIYVANIVGVQEVDLNHRTQRQLFTGRATAVAVLSGGNILIGTPTGLCIKDSGSAPARKSENAALAETCITGILATGDNTALVSTNAQGLFLAADGGRVIQNVKIAGNEVPDNIRSLYKQDSVTYWAATNKGAFSLTFDKHWHVIRQSVYTFYDGLPSNNVTGIYVFKDTAYIATTQGLGVIPLKPGHTPPARPSVYIDKMLADTTTFFEPDSFLSLQPEQNNLQFRLSAISFESFGNIQYHYKLSPLQNNWETTANPEIRFVKLPPGDYRLTVYATSAKGINSQPRILRFRIGSAFWQTPLFLSGITLLAILVLLFFFRLVLKRGERKRIESLQQKKRLAELELEAIKAQINPHFIYNCLNSIKYLNYTGSYQLTEQYLSLFARLIRTTMQHSRRTFVTVEEEIGYLTNYLQLEKLRFKDKLDYFFEVDITGNTLIPAMLLQPYVENALKHGIAHRESGGKVWITIRKREETIEISIRDNGSGFSNTSTQDAMGIRLSATRATTYNDLFNTDIRVALDNAPGAGPETSGAIIHITFKPITHEQYQQQRSYH